MNKKESNIMRNALTQLTGSLTDAGFTALVTACNLPAGLSLAAAQSLVVCQGTGTWHEPRSSVIPSLASTGQTPRRRLNLFRGVCRFSVHFCNCRYTRELYWCR